MLATDFKIVNNGKEIQLIQKALSRISTSKAKPNKYHSQPTTAFAVRKGKETEQREAQLKASHSPFHFCKWRDLSAQDTIV